MNIKRKGKGQPIHKVREGRQDSVCGLIWRGQNDAEETAEEVTCKHCLRIMKGGTK